MEMLAHRPGVPLAQAVGLWAAAPHKLSALAQVYQRLIEGSAFGV